MNSEFDGAAGATVESRSGGADWQRRGRRALSLAVTALCMGLVPALNLRAAGITADAGAPAANRADNTQSLNGTPVLNIVAPNSSGLSHNKFTDFNVGTPGLVINNSRVDAVSKIGGAVPANPSLAGSQASLILNEVTSANRSTLTGPQELLGGQAGYILANPNGITCDGCGFINFPRATLTTGVPVLGIDGGLSGFDVDKGDVLIGALGLNTEEVDHFDIVSRSMVINGAVHAGETLDLVAGRNEVDYTTLAATPKADNGSARPAFAIDSALLGGMYAGRITLVGTEAGVGVRLRGDMAASVDDISLDAAGRISFVGNAVSAQRDIIAESREDAASAGSELVLDGSTLYAARNVALTGGDMTLTGGRTGAGNDLGISAVSFTDGAAGRRDAGNRLDLAVSGAIAVDASTLVADDAAAVNADVLTLSGGASIVAGNGGSGDFRVRVANGVKLDDGALTSGGALTLEAATLSVAAASNANGAKGVRGAGATTVTVAGAIDNAGFIGGDAGLSVNAASLAQATGATMVSTGGAAALTAATLDNAGYLGGDHALTVAAATVIQRGGGVLASLGTLGLDGGGARGINLTTEAGSEIKADALSLDYATVTNAGTLYGQSSAAIVTPKLTNEGTGLISSAGTLGINRAVAGETLSNDGGIEAGTLALYFDAVANAGTLYGQSGLTLVTQSLTNSATLASSGIMSLTQDGAGRTFSNSVNGTIEADDLTLTFTTLDNDGTVFVSTGGRIEAQTVTNTHIIAGSTDVGAPAALTLRQMESGGSLTNDGGAEISAGDLTLVYDGISSPGTLYGDGALSVTTGDFTNAGTIASGGVLTLREASGFDATFLNQAGAVVQGDDVTVSFKNITNSGRVLAGTKGSLFATALNNEAGGTLSSVGSLSLYGGYPLTGSTLVNAATATITGSYLLIEYADVDNAGTLFGGATALGKSSPYVPGESQDNLGESLLVSGYNLKNSGLIAADNGVGINTWYSYKGTVENTDTGIIDGVQVTINGSTITNRGIIHSDLATNFHDGGIQTGDLINEGSIQSLGDVAIRADSVTNFKDVIAGRDILVTRDSNDNTTTLLNQGSSGRFVAARHLSIDSNNYRGIGGDLAVTNDGALLFAGTNLEVLGGQFLNDNGGIVFARDGNVTLGARTPGSTGSEVWVRNVGATIESQEGSVFINAGTFENTVDTDYVPQKVDKLVETRTSGSFDYDGTLDGEGELIPVYSGCGSVYDHFDETRQGHRCTAKVDVYSEQINQPQSIGKVVAGQDLSLYLVGKGLNYLSLLSAGGDLSIQGGANASFENRAELLVHREDAYVVRYDDGGVELNPVGNCYDSSGNYVYCFFGHAADPEPNDALAHRKQFTNISLADDPSYTFVGINSTVEAGGTISIGVELLNNNNDGIKGNATLVNAPSRRTAADPTDPGTSVVPPDGNLSLSLRGSGVGPASLSISTASLDPAVVAGISTLASSPFFVTATDPASRFVFETDPAFGLEGLYGSDLFLRALGIDPYQYTRIGDAYYEQQLLREQLLAEAGQRFIADGLANENEQFKYLLENAVAAQDDLQLRLGVALTAEQIDRLNQDIVWMVETEVNGRKVLVPQLYLSGTTRARLADGAKFVATNIDISTEGPVTNSGAFVASRDIRIDTGASFTNRLGTLEAGTRLSIRADDDILNQSGTLRGKDVSLTTVSGDIRNETLTRDVTVHGATGSGTNTVVGDTATIEAGSSLTLSSGRDIVSRGGDISSEGDASLAVERDLTLTGIEVKRYSEQSATEVTQRGMVVSGDTQSEEGVTTHSHSNTRVGSITRETVRTQTTQVVGSGLTVGGNLDLTSGRDINIEASDVGVAGDARLDVGRDLNLTALAETTHTEQESVTSGVLYRATENTTVDQTTGAASTLATGGNLTVSSGSNVNVVGSDVLVDGDLNVDRVGGNLNVTTFAETTTVHSRTTESSAFGSGQASATQGLDAAGTTAEASATLYKNTDETIDINATTHRGSAIVVGGDLNAGDSAIAGDVNITGSEIATGGDLDLDAGGDMTILAAEDTTTVTQTSNSNQFNLSGEASAGGAGGEFGFQHDTSSGTATQTTAQVSSLSSGGDMGLTAGGDFTEQGTQVEAGGDITVEADSVTSLAAQDTYTESGDSLSVSVGFGVSAETGLDAVVDSFIDEKGKAEFDMADASQSINELEVPDAGSVSVEGSVAVTRTTSSGSGNQATASSFTSTSGDVTFTAREGDATFEGTNIDAAGSIAVSADQGSVKVLAATTGDQSRSDTTSAEVTIGWSDGTVSGEGSGGTEFEETSSTTQTAANWIAGENLDISAKEDVLLVGTNLAAGDTAAITAEEGAIDFMAARDTASTESGSMSVNASVSGGGGEGSIGGGYSTEHSTETSSTATAGSITAGNVKLKSKGDITLEGTDVAGRGDVTFETEGKLDYRAAEDTYEKTTTGMSVQVDVEGGKTGGGASVGGSGTDEYEHSSTKTGGNLSAGNLTIKTGQGARLEGTQVEADAASIDTGSGGLVIESAVSTHTKTVNNTSVEVAAKGDGREGSGQGSFKMEGEYEDTQKVTNQNASLNIGGKLDIQGDGDIDVRGSNVTGLDSVITAGAVDTHGARVNVEQREDVDTSTKSEVGISVGVIVPNKKTRKEVSDLGKKIGDSDAANTVRNKADTVLTKAENASARLTTAVNNKASDLKAAVDNVGADKDTRAANDQANETRKLENEGALANTIHANKDKSTERKNTNNQAQADKKAAVADKQAIRQQEKQDQKADYDRQKADDVAAKVHDKALAKVDKDTALDDAGKKQKKEQIEAEFNQTKKDNARIAADAKKENADTATTARQNYAAKTENRKVAAEDKAAESKTRHAEDTETTKLALADKVTDVGEKNRLKAEVTSEKIQAVVDVAADKERKNADVKARQEKAVTDTGIEQRRQKADIDAQVRADQAIQSIEAKQSKEDLRIDSDTTLTAEQKLEAKQQLAQKVEKDKAAVDSVLAASKAKNARMAAEDAAVGQAAMEKKTVANDQKRADALADAATERAKADAGTEALRKIARADAEKDASDAAADAARDKKVGEADETQAAATKQAGEKLLAAREEATRKKADAEATARQALDDKFKKVLKDSSSAPLEQARKGLADGLEQAARKGLADDPGKAAGEAALRDAVAQATADREAKNVAADAKRDTAIARAGETYAADVKKADEVLLAARQDAVQKRQEAEAKAKTELEAGYQQATEDARLSVDQRQVRLQANKDAYDKKMQQAANTFETDLGKARDDHRDAEAKAGQRQGQEVSRAGRETQSEKKLAQDEFDQRRKDLQQAKDDYDAKLKQVTGDFDDDLKTAREENKKAVDDATKARDQVVADADKERQDTRDTAQQALPKVILEARAEKQAAEQLALDRALDAKHLAAEKRIQDEALADATLTKVKEDRKVLEDPTLDAKAKADKLRDNAVTVADAQEAAKKKYAKEVQNTGDQRDAQAKLREKAAVDNDAGLSDAEKQQKKGEIDQKYKERNDARAEEYKRKEDQAVDEAETIRRIAGAERLQRLALADSKDRVKAATTTADDARAQRDKDADAARIARDKQAETERDKKEQAVDAALSPAQKKEKQESIKADYDKAIAESQQTLNTDLAASAAIRDRELAESAARAGREQAEATARAQRQTAWTEAELQKKRAEQAIKADSTLTQAARDQKLAAVQKTFEDAVANANTRFDAADKIAKATQDEVLARTERERKDAGVDADATLTAQQKQEKKDQNAKDFEAAQQQAQNDLAAANTALKNALTPAEKKAAAALAARSAKYSVDGRVKNPYSRVAKAKSYGSKVMKWKKILTSGGVTITPPVEEEGDGDAGAPTLADLLSLAQQFSAEDQGLALRALRDPEVRAAAVASGAVQAMRGEAREAMLKDMALERHGNELGVLTMSDKRAILAADGIALEPDLPAAEVARRFDAYVDDVVAVTLPTVDQQREILGALGKDALDMSDADVEQAFAQVASDGAERLQVVVTVDMRLPAGRAGDLSRGLLPGASP